MDSLRAEIDVYMVGDEERDTPPAFILELEDGPKRSHVHLLRVRDLPAERWGLIAGDALHNFRSALDHITWQMVLQATGKDDYGKPQFPIFESRADFLQKGRRMVSGMTAEQVAALERLQPYSIWPEHPEATAPSVLHRLNIIDKHRRLNLTDVLLKDCELAIADPAVADLHPVPTPRRVRDRTRIGTAIWKGQRKVRVQLHYSFDVVFEGLTVPRADNVGEGLASISMVLEETATYLDETLPELAPFV